MCQNMMVQYHPPPLLMQPNTGLGYIYTNDASTCPIYAVDFGSREVGTLLPPPPLSPIVRHTINLEDELAFTPCLHSSHISSPLKSSWKMALTSCFLLILPMAFRGILSTTLSTCGIL